MVTEMDDEIEDFGMDLNEAAAALADLPPLEGHDIALEQDEPGSSEDEKGESQENETGEPEQPAIAIPASLTAEEKARFAQLPTEAQRMLSDVESRRARQVTEATTNAANAQRSAQSEAARTVAAATKQHAAQLNAFLTAYAPREPNPADFGNDMQAYSVARAQWQYAAGQHHDLMRQVQAIEAEGQQMTDRQRMDWVQGEQQKLRSTLPDYFDVDKGPKLREALISVGSELGYSHEMLEQADAGEMLALNKALGWRRDSIKLKAIMDRQMQGVRAAKRSATPGAQQPQGQVRRQVARDAGARLAKSGSLEDAAAAIAAQLK